MAKKEDMVKEIQEIAKELDVPEVEIAATYEGIVKQLSEARQAKKAQEKADKATADKIEADEKAARETSDLEKMKKENADAPKRNGCFVKEGRAITNKGKIIDAGEEVTEKMIGEQALEKLIKTGHIDDRRSK